MGMIRQIIWLAFYNLHVIPNINTKFDNYWPSTFGDSLSNKNRDGRRADKWTDRQIDGQTDIRKRETYFFVL